MSEPNQQPKFLLRKPKKSQRSPSDPSSSLSKGDGTGGARSVSTASSNSVPPPKQPLWYRFRTALTTLLVVNAVVIGYTVFRTMSKPSETSEEDQSVENTATEIERDEKKPKEETATERAHDEKKPIEEAATEQKDGKKPIDVEIEIEKENAENVHTERLLPEPSKVPQAINLQEISKQKISSEDQQELFKWLLAEKRKVKPTNKAERAQIDAEKALLKEFLRGKSVLNV